MKPISILLSAIGAAIIGALIYSRRAKAAPSPQPSPQPAPTPQPQAPTPVPTSPPTSDSSVNETTYSTPPSEAALTDPGWVSFNGVEITAVPLTDRRTGLFARLKHRDALAVAASMGAELLEEKDFIALHAAAQRGEILELVPVTLVHSAADGQHMASLDFAKRHDAEVHKQLDAKHWDGQSPVSNIGKYWLKDGANFGWYSPMGTSRDSAGNKIIQSIGHAHVDASGQNNHIDYSQVTMLKRRA